MIQSRPVCRESLKVCLTVALAVGVLIASPGCIVTGSRTVEVEGKRVSAFSLEQLEKGVTTEDWVLAAFGEPSRRELVAADDTNENCEIWRYDWVRREKSSGAVLLIFAGSERTEESESTFIEFTDGVVSGYWTETNS
ncbi:MAG: hypothetical protein ACF8PN_00320 [Phycisphaerales bacterium]